jgi:hypothetical protein
MSVAICSSMLVIFFHLLMSHFDSSSRHAKFLNWMLLKLRYRREIVVFGRCIWESVLILLDALPLFISLLILSLFWLNNHIEGLLHILPSGRKLFIRDLFKRGSFLSLRLDIRIGALPLMGSVLELPSCTCWGHVNLRTVVLWNVFHFIVLRIRI